MRVDRPAALVSDLAALEPGDGVALFLPTHGMFPAELADVLMAMPLVDTNAELRRALPARALPANQVYAGIFAADPFAIWQDLQAALRAAGIAGVVNLPSVSLHVDETVTQLDEVGIGFARECDRLREFRQAGFRIALALRDAAQAEMARDLQPDFVVLVGNAGMDAAQIEKRAAAMRAIFGEIAIHLVDGGGIRRVEPAIS